jgi:5-methylcytosine-specific restriction endonuclease McrA
MKMDYCDICKKRFFVGVTDGERYEGERYVCADCADILDYRRKKDAKHTVSRSAESIQKQMGHGESTGGELADCETVGEGADKPKSRVLKKYNVRLSPERLLLKCAFCSKIYTAASRVGRYCGATCRRAASKKNYDAIGGLYGWANMVAECVRRHNKTCARCGETKGRLNCHHIVPFIDGGSNEQANLILLCTPCHSQAHRELNAGKLAIF